MFTKEFISNTCFGKMNGKWGKRNFLTIRQKQTYLDHCIDCAEESLNNFLNEAGISLYDIDLVIPSQSPHGFISGMKKRTGIQDKFVEITKKYNKEFHTAGPTVALKKVWEENFFKTSKNIIFLTVGAGICVSIALYNNQD